MGKIYWISKQLVIIFLLISFQQNIKKSKKQAKIENKKLRNKRKLKTKIDNYLKK